MNRYADNAGEIASQELTGALSGVLVISLEQAIAAPMATLRMVQAGARVVKVERPEGDFARGYDRAAHGESAFFLWLNRGKQSAVLDLKAAEDAALLRRMVLQADVFVQNLAPGAAERLGFGAEALHSARPELVICNISGYGEEEPQRSLRAYDMLVQAESGLASVSGSAEEPGRMGVSICDLGAGMNAYAAVLEALLQRMRTGRGAVISVSLFHSAVEWMAPVLAHQECYGEALPRSGLRHPLICPYGRFACADGRELLIAIQNQREWERLCRHVLECPEWATDPRYASNVQRVAHRQALEAGLQARFKERPAAQWRERLLAHGIAHGAVNTPAEVLHHPALRRVAAISSGGALQLPASPLHQGAAEPLRAPALGEHSAALREEFSA